MRTLKGLLIGAGIGLGISMLIGLFYCGQEACALVTCSNDRPLTEMNFIPIAVVMIVSTLIGGLVGFCMDMAEHSSTKKYRAKLRHDELIKAFNLCVQNAYAKSTVINRIVVSADDYKEVHNFLDSNKSSPYINELINIYQNCANSHLKYIASELSKLKNRNELQINGLNAMISVCNHIYHYSLMGNNQLSNLVVQLRKVALHIEKGSFFIDENKYGQIDQSLYNKATADVVNIESIYNNVTIAYNKIMSFNDLYALDNLCVEYIDLVIVALYGYAFLKPFDANKYQKVYSIYESFSYTLYEDENYSDNIYIIPPIDCIFSKIIAYYRMGKGVLNQIKSDIDLWGNACISGQNGLNPGDLVKLSSGLMWLGEYELELELLRKAASVGVQLTPEVQERLAFLESGGSVGPELYNEIDTNVFNYDYSSLKWSDKDFNNFFKNLAFKNTKLTYALAVSEFKKSFKSKFKTPITYEMILDKLNKMAKDEYLGEINCSCIKVNSLSEEFNEYDDAIIINLTENIGINHAAILLFYNKIGVNINVQILTVFTPVEDADGSKNMKLAISLKQETSPKVTQTLESIRDSVARQIDELCGSNPDAANSIY